jgi:HD-GYP domain-containing protein (c-di-GMP phosphodiesterase class II)
MMSDRSSAVRSEPQPTQFMESGLLTLARDLVRALNVALRTARIHDMKNEAALAAMEAFAASANDLFRLTGVFSVKVVGDYLFWNDSRIKADAGSYAAFDHMAREFRTRGIGSLTFHDAIDLEAIRALIDVLATAPVNATEGDAAESGDAWKFLNERLAERTKAFELGPYHPYDITDVEKEQIDNKERAKKTFFRAVAVTRAIMSSTRLSEQMDLRKAKRVVQTMVDMMLEEEFSFLGLTTIKEYDNYTFFHSVNVCILSIAIGKRIGLDKKRLSELGVAALLHDIGKTEIPTNVLRKPGRFDKAEWDMMKEHPMLGVRVLLRLKGFSDLGMKSMVVAFEHHLGYNLSGYPSILKPRPPHLFSRIVTVSDCFDAMTTQRVYSDGAPKPRDKAMSYMLSQSGKQFDPVILKYFVNLIGIYPIGCLVRLNTEQIGVVIATHPDAEDPRRPIVKIITDPTGIEIDGPLVNLMAESGWSIGGTVDPSRFNIDTSRYFL